jgi:hypothetical protein
MQINFEALARGAAAIILRLTKDASLTKLFLDFSIGVLALSGAVPNKVQTNYGHINLYGLQKRVALFVAYCLIRIYVVICYLLCNYLV